MHRIRYFTALVEPNPGNPDNRTRQNFYILARKTIPHLSVHEGRFAKNEKWRPIADLHANKPTEADPLIMVPIIEREEKGSDVNLASFLMLDAAKRDCELAVVLSNDSDLAETIRLVQSEFGVQVRIVNPRRFLARDLQGIATFYANIRFEMVKQSQFPRTMSDANGSFSKPSRW